MSTLGVVLVALAIAVGLVGIVVPVLPGGLLVFAAIAVWAIVLIFGSAGFSLIMRYGPDRRPAKWRWILPGALFALVLWMLISGGFSLYVAYISNYNSTYGSLAAIVVFVMWLYLSSYVLLLGALLNAETERQTLVDTTIGPDEAMGERGAVIADSHVALGMVRLHEKRGRRPRRLPGPG